MKTLRVRRGDEAPKWQHTNYHGESLLDAVQLVMADLLALAPSFFVSGAQRTFTSLPGGGGQVDITDGVVVLQGEPMIVQAGSIVRSSTQLAFLDVVEDPMDPIPVRNLDGTQSQVMIRRRAKLAVANVMPAVSMSLLAPEKADLERLRFKGRLVPKGTIMPYAGDMTFFSANGLGQAGTVMEGWAVANGANGTVDMRGLVPVGATNVPSSGAPGLSPNVEGTSVPGELVGNDQVTLEANQLPEHRHPYNDYNREWAGGSGISSGSGYTGAMSDTARTSGDNVTTNAPVSVKQAGRAFVYIQSIA